MNQRKSKKKWIILIPVIAVVIALVAFPALKKKNAPEKEEVQTVQAATMTIENTITSDGEIISSLEEKAEPHTSYYLEDIRVEQGQALSEGDTILTYTNGETMEAPYNCVVESWELPDEEEQLTDDHYVQIAGTDVMQMEFTVSEEDVAQVKPGDEAQITVDAVNGKYTGTVTYVSDVGDYSGGSSTYDVKVSFDSDEKLKLGMTGSVSLVLERAENVVAVPSAAVVTGRGVSSVITVDGDEQKSITVETGISNGSFTEIKSGITEGTSVVVMSSDDDDSFFGGGFPGGGGGFPGGMPDGASGGGSGERPSPSSGGGSGERPSPPSGGGMPGGSD